MIKQQKLDYNSPIGVIEIIGTDEAICSIMFSERDITVNIIQDETPKVLMDCYRQLDEYFKGELYEFTFPYIYEGTDFQKTVWNALRRIPYAKTGSYKDIAVSIGNERAIRAVGSANGKNKLSIVIPCHRIIGSNGKLTGYASGLWRKEWLLQHEKSLQCKKHGRLTSVVSIVDKDNTPSVRILENLPMSFIKEYEENDDIVRLYIR